MAKNNKNNVEKTKNNATTPAPEQNTEKKGIFSKLFSLKKDSGAYEYSNAYDYSQNSGHSKRTVRLVGDESNFAMREAYKSGRTNYRR